MTTPDQEARQTALAIVRLAVLARQTDDHAVRSELFHDIRTLYRTTDDTETLVYGLANIASRTLEHSAECLGLDAAAVASGLCLIEAESHD